MSDQEEFNREQSRANLQKMLDAQAQANAFLRDFLDRLRLNSDGLDIGQYNQLLRAISVHYPSCDDFLMAAAAAWIDMNRKKLEGQ